MLRINLLDELLDKFLNEVPELIAVLVVDLDGLVIAQKSLKGFDEEIIGAIMTILDQTINKIKRFTDTSYGSGTFDTNEFRLFYTELVTTKSLFVLVADPYSNIEQYIPYSYIIADKASQLLNNRETSLNLPKLDIDNNEIYIPDDNSADGKTEYNKVVIIGPQQVGKTTLLNMYVNGEFEQNYRPTIGVHFIEKSFQLTNRLQLKFYIFDLSGVKSFGKIRRFYYPDSQAVILLFDYSNPESLEKINEWFEEARHFIEDNSTIYLLVGNKIDLVGDRLNLKEKAEKIATQYGCNFFEISAATGEGIDELFTYLVSNTM
ncbi:MAG: GTP-binding protein [Candidatus Lokiarchaeota archaeon]|nr:GTP-binding protein [Candidatus Lokiarchaeota archaeon]MBD3198649.1 GTP-binding protein [Candidatus Lokiarchaeota archaeon]